MDLITWSLSAIDTIFSQKKGAPGEPICPGGTFAAGYSQDAWKNWQVLCLEALSVEGVEDIYMFGFMIAGFLLIGLGNAFNYRKICKTAAFKSTQPLSTEIKKCFHDVGESLKGLHQRDAQSEELTRDLSARTVDIQKIVHNTERQTGELLCGLTDVKGLHQGGTRIEELIRIILARSEDTQKRVDIIEKLTGELLRCVSSLNIMKDTSRLLHDMDSRN